MENSIYMEKIPNHYIRPDVSVTIHTNDKGLGLAEVIKCEIKKILAKYSPNNEETFAN